MPRAPQRPLRLRRSVIGGVLLAGLAACQPVRPPAPLEDDPAAPREERVTRPEPTPLAAPAPTPSTLREEALAEFEPVATPDPAAPLASGTAVPTPTALTAASGGGRTGELPSPLDTIGPGTAPNVAAATRLVEAARRDLVAGNDSAALERLERAIAVDPNNPYAYCFLALLHLRTRTYDQAIAFADRAATLARATSPAWASRAFTLQGQAYEFAGRFADARQAYQRAVQAAPDNHSAAGGLARTGGAPAPGAP